MTDELRTARNLVGSAASRPVEERAVLLQEATVRALLGIGALLRGDDLLEQQLPDGPGSPDWWQVVTGRAPDHPAVQASDGEAPADERSWLSWLPRVSGVSGLFLADALRTRPGPDPAPADASGPGEVRLVPEVGLTDAERDAEVWIPPTSDVASLAVSPCGSCGSERMHMRTGRCSQCGRRTGMTPVHGAPGSAPPVDAAPDLDRGRNRSFEARFRAENERLAQLRGRLAEQLRDLLQRREGFDGPPTDSDLVEGVRTVELERLRAVEALSHLRSRLASALGMHPGGATLPHDDALLLAVVDRAGRISALEDAPKIQPGDEVTVYVDGVPLQGTARLWSDRSVRVKVGELESPDVRGTVDLDALPVGTVVGSRDPEEVRTAVRVATHDPAESWWECTGGDGGDPALVRAKLGDDLVVLRFGHG